MRTAQPYPRRCTAILLPRGIATAGLLAAALLFGGCGDTVTPEPPTLTGEWSTAQDPARPFFPEADTIRFALQQTGTLVTGTWGATGAGGEVVRPNQQVEGEVVDGSIELILRYSPSDHGCVGDLYGCYDLFYRVAGEFRGANEVRARLTDPPDPWNPQPPTLAEWMLRRRP